MLVFSYWLGRFPHESVLMVIHLRSRPYKQELETPNFQVNEHLA